LTSTDFNCGAIEAVLLLRRQGLDHGVIPEVVLTPKLKVLRRGLGIQGHFQADRDGIPENLGTGSGTAPDEAVDQHLDGTILVHLLDHEVDRTRDLESHRLVRQAEKIPPFTMAIVLSMTGVRSRSVQYTTSVGNTNFSQCRSVSWTTWTYLDSIAAERAVSIGAGMTR